MRKLLFLLLLFPAALGSVNAQKGFSFGAGARLGFPVNDFADTQSFGLGLELQTEYNFSRKFSAVFNTGYTHFTGEEVSYLGTYYRNKSIDYFPILAGVRVYPLGGLFVGMQAGYGVLSNASGSGGFNWQPQVGFGSKNVQVAVNLNGISVDGKTLSHVGFTALYRFGGAGSK